MGERGQARRAQNVFTGAQLQRRQGEHAQRYNREYAQRYNRKVVKLLSCAKAGLLGVETPVDVVVDVLYR